jgi:hypothetical protein
MSDVHRTFHKTLYTHSALKDAMDAYSGLAEISIEQAEDEAWTVTFTKVDADFTSEQMASEFANYVLAETINGRR